MCTHAEQDKPLRWFSSGEVSHTLCLNFNVDSPENPPQGIFTTCCQHYFLWNTPRQKSTLSPPPDLRLPVKRAGPAAPPISLSQSSNGDVRTHRPRRAALFPPPRSPRSAAPISRVNLFDPPGQPLRSVPAGELRRFYFHDFPKGVLNVGLHVLGGGSWKMLLQVNTAVNLAKSSWTNKFFPF